MKIVAASAMTSAAPANCVDTRGMMRMEASRVRTSERVEVAGVARSPMVTAPM
jgi:hypothetical protein